MIDLRQALADYLTLRRSMGFLLTEADRILSRFLTYLEERGATYITTALACEWATSPTGTRPYWWATRLMYVRLFAKYLQHFDSRTEVPASNLIVYRQKRRVPYIYSDDDVRSLVQAARALPDPFHAATYATLFGLLAATGMRGSEAISLDRNDVDFAQGLLTIRRTKFGKSRELPLHPSTLRALRAYAHTRDRFLRDRPTPCFFASLKGTRLRRQNMHFLFLRLLRPAGLWERQPHRPTIHDLRHSFAVRTLTDWYRTGLDTAPRLPALSTYLGHVGPAATYWYLSATPELLALASERAERAKEVRS